MNKHYIELIFAKNISYCFNKLCVILIRPFVLSFHVLSQVFLAFFVSNSRNSHSDKKYYYVCVYFCIFYNKAKSLGANTTESYNYKFEKLLECII